MHYYFSTAQHLVNLFRDITAEGFGDTYTKFGVLLSTCVGYDCLKLGVQIFFSYFDVGACIF